MRVTEEKIQNIDISSRKEWVISNGIGGFASSTILGLNTRKYHALLVAALGDSGDRYVVLPKINESISIEGENYSISTNECGNFLEKGYKNQLYFRKSYLPSFYYEVAGVSVTKTISLEYGANKVAIAYLVKTTDKDVIFNLQPLVNYRKFHTTRSCYYLDCNVKENAVNVKLNSHGHVLHMITSGAEFEKYTRTYYKNMFYSIEEERGFEAYEDHFMPGVYEVRIPKNKEVLVEFVAYVDEDENSFAKNANALEIINREETRLEKVCRVAEVSTLEEKHLAVAADSFIVKKGNRKTIIAGYPWFGDWGRDTFIAFEGLLLATNRFRDAKEIILSFKDYIQDGLIPNLIDENGGGAYNTVDASLWYIDAVYKYYKHTSDIEFVKTLYPYLKQIIDAYINGTKYDICMDKEDCLIRAGSPETQLTWMDAKVGDYIPTPRYGKPVEINALWYNALKIMEEFAMELHEDFEQDLSQRVKASFRKFYNSEGLFDVLEPNSEQIRPNQIFAIGLEFSPVEDEKAREILKVVEEKLYTSKGLKTLSAEDKEYRGMYCGDSYNRDSSYHQGTVWPWLLIPYFKASRKYNGKYKRLENVNELINEDCIGSICEIYDADEPHLPKGAYSQAWSVAMAILNS